MSHILLLILTIIAIIAIFISFYVFINEYRLINLKYKRYRKEVEKRYIKVDVRLWNAVLEAYEQASARENEYEKKIFFDLLEELKGKW